MERRAIALIAASSGLTSGAPMDSLSNNKLGAGSTIHRLRKHKLPAINQMIACPISVPNLILIIEFSLCRGGYVELYQCPAVWLSESWCHYRCGHNAVVECSWCDWFVVDNVYLA